jgi:hypothetical protein
MRKTNERHFGLPDPARRDLRPEPTPATSPIEGDTRPIRPKHRPKHRPDDDDGPSVEFVRSQPVRIPAPDEVVEPAPVHTVTPSGSKLRYYAAGLLLRLFDTTWRYRRWWPLLIGVASAAVISIATYQLITGGGS